MSHVLVTHAPEDEARAALVAEKLGALGFEVRQDADIYRGLSPFERRKLMRAVEEAACVLVLWSREAGEAPALRAAAERAAARGKLALARLDSAVPPLPGAANLSGWLGRDGRSWRQLVGAIAAVAKKPAKRLVAARPMAAAVNQTPAEEPKKRGGAGGVIALLVILALLGGGAYYAWSSGLIALG